MRPCAFRLQGANPHPTMRLQSSRLFYHGRGRDRIPIARHSSRWLLFGMADARKTRACSWHPPLYLGIYTETNASRTLMRAKRKLWLLNLILAVQLTFASAANAKDVV